MKYDTCLPQFITDVGDDAEKILRGWLKTAT